MQDERVANQMIVTADDIQDTRRETRFLEDLPKKQPAGDDGLGGRLQDDGISESQRGRRGAAAQMHRPIPGADDRGDNHRDAVDPVLLAWYVAGHDATPRARWQGRRLENDSANRRPFELRLDAN